MAGRLRGYAQAVGQGCLGYELVFVFSAFFVCPFSRGHLGFYWDL